MEEQGVIIDKNDLTTLSDNMQSLAKQWRSSSENTENLMYHIDAC
jgi:hypothetical protein